MRISLFISYQTNIIIIIKMSLFQLSNPQLKSQILQYYQHPQFTPAPASLQHLFNHTSPISTIHYLYQQLTVNSTIKNKRKRLILVDTFYQLLLSHLDTLIQQFKTTSIASDIIGNILMKVVNVPTIVLNFDPKKNLILETYRWMVANMKEWAEGVKLDVVKRMVGLGQYEVLFENNSEGVADVVKRSFQMIPTNYNILVYLASIKSPLFTTLFESFSQQKLKIKMIQKLLFSTRLPPSFASILHNIPLPQTHTQSFLQTLLLEWSDKQFLNQTPYTQKLITNYIVLKMREMNVEYLNQALAVINQGITMRFEFNKGFEFVRDSGLIVWRTYVDGLGIGEDDMGQVVKEKGQLFVDDIEETKEQVKATVISKQGNVQNVYIPKSYQKQSPQSPAKTPQQHQQQQYNFEPKNLYDCYLGIVSDNYQRKQTCLKSVPELVRTHEPDIIFTYQKILNSILFAHDPTSIIKSFDQLRVTSLTSIIIYSPIESIQIITNRFYNKQCCLADKVMILNSLNHAVQELSNNPKKYQIQKKEKDKDKQFYFKRVTSKYYNQSQTVRQQKQAERQSKLQSKSRRWGHTKRQYQNIKLSLSDTSSNSLVPIKSVDFLINDPFVNRLYELVDKIFFTFVYKIPTLGYLLKDTGFLECLFGMLNTFLSNIENYYNKYRIVQEVIDILNVIKQNNPQIQKGKIGVLLKIVGVFDKNINYHELVLMNVYELLREFYEYQKKSSDPVVKIMLGIIEERLDGLLETRWEERQKYRGGKKNSNVLLISEL